MESNEEEEEEEHMVLPLSLALVADFELAIAREINREIPDYIPQGYEFMIWADMMAAHDQSKLEGKR